MNNKAVGLLLLLAMSLASCSKDEIPDALKGLSLVHIYDIVRDSIPPIYLPWTPDTSLGVRYHKLTVKEFGLVNDTDTIVHMRGFARPTHRWIEGGYPVKYDRDTSYSLLPDSVPASFYFQATFKTYYPYGED